MLFSKAIPVGAIGFLVVAVLLNLGGCPPPSTRDTGNNGVNAGGSQSGSSSARKFHFGVFPGDASATGNEDDPTLALVQSFEQAVGRSVGWVYFSHNWYGGRAFPQAIAEWIRTAGATPFIRLMLRSDAEQNHAEPLYTLDAILAGDFDSDLAAWGAAAKRFGTPLLVEWGTECNGQWFSWNGVWNGGATTDGFSDPNKADGPERFVSAFRHIVDAINGAGADNITWVFHVNAPDVPDEAWNQFENYYPGDAYVDWLAISVYGAGTPLDTEVEAFRAQLDPEYDRLTRMAPGKPVIVAEIGSTANNVEIAPEQWTDLALTDLFGGRWSGIVGFAWWNEGWPNDDNPAHDTNMRVQDIPALADVFRRQFEQNRDKLQDPPALR